MNGFIDAEIAVERLDSIQYDDPEHAHNEADSILLAVCPIEVRAAYERVIQRQRWWATA